MIQLTVGTVAGFIALAIFVARQVCPNALAYILSKRLGFRNSAATWTVSAKVLQQSYWPLFVRSDDWYGNGVRRSVLWISKSVPAVSILLSVASVVTPFGLYSSTALGKPVRATFVHAQDASPFGLHGTMTRTNYSITRACGSATYANTSFRYESRPCPLSDEGDDASEHSPDTRPSHVDPRCCLDVKLPASLIDIYSSGFRNTTVANSLDIQWRQYAQTTKAGYLNGSAYMVGRYRSVRSLLLDETVSVVEGLVVDTVRGGIGFRNHTVPVGFQRAVTWHEDLLFIEPETVCVDTNLTLDYTADARLHWGAWPVSRVELTDRGGFANLDLARPAVDLSNPQANPDLRGRALAAAWQHNVVNAMWLNLTDPSLPLSGVNSTLGQKYPFTRAYLTGYPDFSISKDFFNEFWVYQNYRKSQPGLHMFGRQVAEPANSTNSYNVRLLNYTLINDLCQGVDDSSPASSRNILVSCGLMQSIPQRRDGGDPFSLEDGIHWTKKLYSCASTTKATIKTVTLSYDGAAGRLNGLKVTAIKDKRYPDEASMPLWGVEDVGGRYQVGEISLLWGLVSPEHEGRANVTTYRQPSLYLPGRMSTARRQIPFMADGDNLAGSDFASNMWLGTYCSSLDREARGEVSFGDCSEKLKYEAWSNIALWAKWQRLTESAATASLVPNLIFTDFSASAVVGTRSALSLGSRAGPKSDQLPILLTPEITVVRYRFWYAVPAIVSAIVVSAIVGFSFVLTCIGHDGLTGIRQHVQRLAPGRIYTTLLAPPAGGSDLSMRSEDWSRGFGRRVIDLSPDRPVAVHKDAADDSADGEEPGRVDTELTAV